MDDIRDFIRRLPKAELHLHLEGTITPATLADLSARHDAQPIPLAEAEALYEFTDFSGFLDAFKAVCKRLIGPDDYELAAWRMMERLAEQGVVHAEVYISVGVIYMGRNHDPHAFEPIFAGLERARERGQRELGISLYWIFDAVRHFGPEEAARVFRKAAELRTEFPSIIGIGIGGDERRMSAEPFRDLYAEARDAGLHLTAHAGETTGPENIWGALNIGAERLGHALSAIHDPELMDLLAERQIPLEICLTSNLRTGCCPRIEDHPVRRYFDAGLMVTLNSDDPALFHSDLAHEYLSAQKHFDFTDEHLRELAANSIEASFLPPERKVTLLRCVESLK